MLRQRPGRLGSFLFCAAAAAGKVSIPWHPFGRMPDRFF